MDKDYKDGRKPEGVVFTSNLEEDLNRRDFTINAMAYNPKRGLVDLFSGQEDLKNKLLNTVGDPKERFNEDYLRMLRAIRFANRFDLKLAKDVENAIKKNASSIGKISKERIQAELSQILLSDKPDRGVSLLQKMGLLKYIAKDLDEMVGFDQKTIHHQYDLFEHTMQVLGKTPKDLIVRLAALFHDIGKLSTMSIDKNGQAHFYGHDKASAKKAQIELTKLRYDKKIISQVIQLIEKHMNSANTYTDKSVKRLLRKIGKNQVERLFALQEADILATNNPHFIENIHNARKLLKNILESQDLVYENQVEITGKDLIEIGYKEGIELGQALAIVKNQVLEGNLENDRQIIIKYIKERSKKDEKTNSCRFQSGIK